MTLVKFNRNQTPFSRIWDDFFNEFDQLALNTTDHGFAKANIIEADKHFRIELAVPGFEKNDFEIKVDNQLLTVKVEKEHTESESNEKYRRREFSFSSFKRSFTLPKTVNGEEIKANYENGILQLEIPKREEAMTKPSRLIEIS